MTDPLTRVPGIWRPCLAVEMNGTPGHLLKMNPGPGLNWFADLGPDYQSGVDRILAEAWGREQLQPVILLDDPTGATTGCLQAFCRELYGDPFLYSLPDLAGGWCIMRRGRSVSPSGDDIIGEGATEAAAWKVAILTHPSLAGLQ